MNTHARTYAIYKDILNVFPFPMKRKINKGNSVIKGYSIFNMVFSLEIRCSGNAIDTCN